MRHLGAALLVLASVIAVQAAADTVTVYRCVKDGHTTLSDQPCAPNAKVEETEYKTAPNDPSLMVQPGSPSLSHSKPAPMPAGDANKPSTQVGSKKVDPCEQAQQRIDNINAQMREGYTSQRGEYLREGLRSAQKAYSDCRNKNQ